MTSLILINMCTSPVTIRYSNIHTLVNGFRSIQVPCGKCMECRKRYQNDWCVRFAEEFRSVGYVGVFVTLTYRNESVPTVYDKETGAAYYSVCKKHVQNAIKRFRTSYFRANGKSAVFRYFVTSEYGPRTCRPHYHAIFFGLRKADVLPFLEDWFDRYGFYKADDVKGDPNAVGRYVAKYCSKGVFECPYVAAGFVAPTFHLMSKGLGRSFVERPDVIRYYCCWTPSRKYKYKDGAKVVYSDEFLNFVGFELRCHVSGILYSMPRYYRAKLYGSQTDLSRQVADYVFRRNCDILDNECRKVQAERHCSYGEALYHINCEKDREMAFREKTAKCSFERFLDRSKL